MRPVVAFDTDTIQFEFQSLLYWISRCGYRDFLLDTYPDAGFQSLFYWISRCGNSLLMNST